MCSRRDEIEKTTFGGPLGTPLHFWAMLLGKHWDLAPTPDPVPGCVAGCGRSEGPRSDNCQRLTQFLHVECAVVIKYVTTYQQRV